MHCPRCGEWAAEVTALKRQLAEARRELEAAGVRQKEPPRIRPVEIAGEFEGSSWF